MAPKIEKFCSPGKGNGLRTVCRVSAGELLYTAVPFAYTVSKEGRGLVCEFCFAKKQGLLRCSRCKFVSYCDTSCQKQAWQDHKRECLCLKSVSPSVPTDSVRLVGRIIFKVLRQSSCLSEELYSLRDLESNISRISEEMKEGIMSLAVMLNLYLKEEVKDVSRLLPTLDILDLFAKVSCNCFSIYDGEMQDVGVGLYPSMALLNHSCDPNCVIVFNGSQLLLHSVCEIQAGEELTIAYIDLIAPSFDRNKELLKRYCFICDCHRCQTQDKDTEMLMGVVEICREVQASITTVENLKSRKDWVQVLAVCRTMIKRSDGALPDANIYKMKLLDYAMDASINICKWDEALQYGCRTLEPYKLYCGCHPVRAVQLMKLGKLLMYQGMLCKASDMLIEAFEVMKVTHGREHSLTKELYQLLFDCETEMGLAL
ncbi:histone-lysine N-methyltransferase SMYD3 [Protopterus annectens]|uniref:histone-lysine N-methyltransferase SMYD3 n=1 Tax=Protopterus annectens TaxID=7888 RepID=UPI001CFA6EE5|nr:histone-lysine N-methyltransferase SMYD3 [Protopterus annectens]XP_043916584.1 histone-lysine N-methyltransferase SMYD3 [Protopterus annectens]